MGINYLVGEHYLKVGTLYTPMGNSPCLVLFIPDNPRWLRSNALRRLNICERLPNKTRVDIAPQDHHTRTILQANSNLVASLVDDKVSRVPTTSRSQLHEFKLASLTNPECCQRIRSFHPSSPVDPADLESLVLAVGDDEEAVVGLDLDLCCV